MKKKDKYSVAKEFINKYGIKENSDIWELKDDARKEYDSLNYYIKLVITSILYRKN